MLSRLRWNKVLRDAWRHKGRSVLVVLAIAVGVASFGMVLASRDAARADMYAGYWRNVPPNMILYLDGFGEDVLSIVDDVPGVGQVEARKVVNAKLQTAGSDQWTILQVNVLQDYSDSRISVVRPEVGAWPPGRREIVLERSAAYFYGIEIGDTIVVEMPNGAQKELRVTGTAHEFNYHSSVISQMARGFVDWDTLEWLGEDVAYNVLYATVAENGTELAHVESVRSDVLDRLERCGYPVRGFGSGFDSEVVVPGRHWADDFYSALMLILGVVGALTLVLSGFLVMNTTMALLAQETRQIGVMKAVGGKRGQIVGIYLSTVTLYGGLALAVAVPLGLAGGRWFTDFSSYVMNYDIDSYGVIPWVLALQIGMAIGVPALAALVPVYQGTRKTVREAIGDYGIGEGRAGFFDRLMAHVRGLPRPLMFSLRNVFRRKARLLLTLGALSLAGAIFIGVFSTRDSMVGLFCDMFALFGYHVEINLGEPTHAQRIESVAAQVEGVTRVESWLALEGTRVLPDDTMGETHTFMGLPLDQQTVVPTILEGRWLRPGDRNAVVIGVGTLRQSPDLGVGSEITVEIAGHRSSWQVVGVVLFTEPGFAYVNYPALAEASGMVGRANRVAVQIADADSAQAQKTALRALEERYERAGLAVQSSYTIAETVQRTMSQIDMVVYLLLMMAVLLAVVGGLGLAATMGLNVLERTREIGVLRAIGATNRAMWSIVVAEGVLVGFISWVLGTLLSYPLGNLLNGGMGMAFVGLWIEYTFSYAGVWLWLAVVLVVSALASLAPARRASCISVREALAYE
ncbi:MAG: ABC transporter permease [Anaerolineae bacterium]|jgi:putative ABC transport system permease protein